MISLSFHFLFLGLFLFLGEVCLLRVLVLLFREGINQILDGISNSPIAVLVQFNDELLISVVGSKIENKFLITFSLFC